MAIQDTSALVLDALSVLNDPRPHPKQPVLGNGIYLRWFPGPNRGFPLNGGYVLLRRRVGGPPPAPVCLGPLLAQSAAQVIGTQTSFTTAIGTLAETGAPHLAVLPLPTGGPGIGAVNFDKQVLSFTLPAGVTASSFTVRLRFHWGPTMATVVGKRQGAVVFTQQVIPPGPPPSSPEVTVTATSGPFDRIELTGLWSDLLDLCYVATAPAAAASAATTALPGNGWELVPNLAAPITLPLTHPAYPASAGAESIAASLARATSRFHYGAWGDAFRSAPRTAGPGAVTLTGGSAIAAGSGTNWTADLIGKMICVPKGGTNYTAYAVMDVLAPDRVVLSRAYSGATLAAAPYDLLEGDDFAELHDRVACLVESPGGMRAAASPPDPDRGTVASGKYVQPSNGAAGVQGIGTQWTASLAGTSIEIGPYRSDAGYVADAVAYRIQSVESASHLTLDRPFAGPPVSTPVKADFRIAAGLGSSGGDAPAISLAPMELIELSALFPGYAQALGLSWIDTAVQPGDVFDYLILADHQNRFAMTPANAVAWVNGTPNFAGDGVDGYVFAGVHHVGTAALAAPSQTALFSLPCGTARISLANPNRATADAGMSVQDAATWKNAAAGQPAPVMLNLWRFARGTDAANLLPVGNLSAYQDLGAIVPFAAAAAPTGQLPAGWPAVPIHFLDPGPDGTGLDVGWYSYRLNAVDGFGRYSAISPPVPWTVVPPATPAVADAVHLEDRIAPPPPAGVQAWVLDEKDPYLQRDATYAAWKAAFAQSAPPIGLRVRWRWPWRHRNQGPDLREFRLYGRSRPLNARIGQLISVAPVTGQPAKSAVTIDLGAPDGTAPNAYANADLHAADRSYRILASQGGATVTLTVQNGGPSQTERPTGTDGAIVIPSGHALAQELLDPSKWDPWLAAVPANLAGTRDDVELVADASTKTGLQGTAATWNAATRTLALNGMPDLSNVVAASDLVYVAATGASLANLQFFFSIDAVDASARTLQLGGTPAQLSALAAGAPFAWMIGWPVRLYEVLLPAPNVPAIQAAPNLDIAALVSPSLAQPVAYGSIGVSSADWRDEIADRYKPARNRKGNESFLAAPAPVFRVLRDPPPAPAYTWTATRLWATKADYHDRSYFTMRWNKPAQGPYSAHVFRAMDTSLFLAQWNLTAPLGAPATGAPPGLAPFLASFNASKSADKMREASQLYDALDDATLGWLAAQPALLGAYMQVTIVPLPLADPAVQDRLGPDDDPQTFSGPKPTVCAYVDTLDGKSSNRYFYRVMLLDGAQNRGPLGAPTPPVYLPKVVPPKAPVMTKIAGGEGAIALRWIASRDADVFAYRVYRSETADRAEDVRTMSAVTELKAASLQPSAQHEIAWTDQHAPVGRELFYRVTALDTQNPPNESAPSKTGTGRAVDTVPPKAPVLTIAEWDTSGSTPAVRLVIKTDAAECDITRRAEKETLWKPVGAPAQSGTGKIVFVDAAPPHGVKLAYRAVARNRAGIPSPPSAITTLEAK